LFVLLAIKDLKFVFQTEGQKPKFLITEENFFVVTGRKNKLYCDSLADPRPHFSWEKQGKVSYSFIGLVSE